MIRLRNLACLAAGILALAAAPAAMAQQAVSFVVAYAAGGSTDTLARILGARMSDKLGKPVVIENRAGATGQVGSRHVSKSPPDGSVIQIATQTTHAVAPTLYKNLGYDPDKDFTPIALVAWTPLVLVAHPSVPANTVPELIAYVKNTPKASYATGGRGDGSFVSALFFNNMAKIAPVAVPFPGEGPALPQVLGGHLPYMFVGAPLVASLIETGQLKGIAVTSKVRASNLPKVPPMAEAGLPGYEMVNWWGVFGPPGMAPDLVRQYNAAIVDSLKEPETRSKLTELGFEITSSTAEEFRDYVRKETVKWAEVLKDEAKAN